MIPVAVALRTMTAAGAKAFIRKTERNLTKRVGRLVAKEIDTKAISEYQTLVANKPGPGATRNQLVSYASQLQKLDQNPGTRAATAPTVYRAEQAAATRRQIRKKAEHPVTASELSAAELRVAYKDLQKELQGKARYVRDTFGETHATRKLDEFLDSRKGLDIDDLPRNRLLHGVNRLGHISRFEGISAKGARKQRERGVKLLGDRYNLLSTEQQSAVWDEVMRMQEEDKDSYPSSEIAVAEMKINLNNDDDRLQQVTFVRSPHGHLKAILSADDAHEKRKLTRYLAEQQVREARNERARKKKEERNAMAATIAKRRPKF